MRKQREVKDLGLFTITWPLVITFTFSITLPVIDSWFLSRVSDLAAGAVGAVFSVLMTINMAITSLSQAGVSVASQLMGGRRHDKVFAAYTITLGLSMILGVISSVVLTVLSGRIGLWLGLSPEGNVFAARYLAVLGPFFVLKGVQMTLMQVIASRGYTFLNMVGMIGMNLCNVGLNDVFYNGRLGMPELGVSGVAWATVLSLAVNIGYSALLLRIRLGVVLGLRDAAAKLRELLGPILRIGVPSVVEPVSFQVFQVAVTILVVSLGEFALTTRIYTFNLVLLTVTTSLALGIGTQILVAHLVGAGAFIEADRQIHRSLFAGSLTAVVLVALVWLFAPALIGMFTSNQEIIAFGRRLLLIEFLLEPARAFNVILTQSLRCAGDARYPSYVGAVLMWTVGLGAVYVLGIGLGLGLMGIWFGLFVDEGVRAVFNYTRWRKGIWRTTGVNLAPEQVPTAA